MDFYWLARYFFSRRTKEVSGKVVDCKTGEPIRDATIKLWQTGWGKVNGQLVWDKNFIYQAVSDENGNFTIEYQVGNTTRIIGEKDEYLQSEQWEIAGDSKIVKLLKKDSTIQAREESSRDCVPSMGSYNI